MLVNPARLLDHFVSWPVRSQQGARRNALVASTALAERRRELADVEEFLARRAASQRREETLEVAVRQAR